ncbi:hypothetical protein B0H66DRAFT_591126 [Apodospora peruviana]|uniref:Uncharacterized protein n=1 Tax=Apodospora peruviana TaxID=516989 RepID=A0AAE0I4F7_9PEZI|nr:hypothetical protein B0H66DRAFT_591126 [Apodospora peruviana]
MVLQLLISRSGDCQPQGRQLVRKWSNRGKTVTGVPVVARDVLPCGLVWPRAGRCICPKRAFLIQVSMQRAAAAISRASVINAVQVKMDSPQVPPLPKPAPHECRLHRTQTSTRFANQKLTKLLQCDSRDTLFLTAPAYELGHDQVVGQARLWPVEREKRPKDDVAVVSFSRARMAPFVLSLGDGRQPGKVALHLEETAQGGYHGPWSIMCRAGGTSNPSLEMVPVPTQAHTASFNTRNVHFFIVFLFGVSQICVGSVIGNLILGCLT